MNRFLDERSAEDLHRAIATGAACMYAVYDPVSRRCVMARAGHPPPAVLSTDGKVSFVELPDGPPLGLGGVTFESTEVELADGDLLVLYTDGLVRSQERDLGTGLDLLRETLTASAEDVCHILVGRLLPEHGNPLRERAHHPVAHP